MLPKIQIERERGQYVISFPQGGPATVYYAHRCGLSKSTPWPRGYRSKDFLLTSYPISAPSPIGFPVALFREDSQTGPDHEKGPHMVSEGSGKRMPEHVATKPGKSGDADWPTLLVSIAVTLILAGVLIYLIRRNKRGQK